MQDVQFHEHLTDKLIGLVAEVMQLEASLKQREAVLPFIASLIKADITNLRKEICLIATTARKAGASPSLIEVILKGIKEKK